MFDDTFIDSNAAGEVYPGYPGYVVAGGKMGAMAWGFPLALKSKRTGQPLKPKPKPVNTDGKSLLIDSFVILLRIASQQTAGIIAKNRIEISIRYTAIAQLICKLSQHMAERLIGFQIIRRTTSC